jgi:hypothetical protein
MVDCCIMWTFQALFLHPTTDEWGCFPTTIARGRTIHQLQLPAIFHVYVLPLLLQTLGEIKIWLIVVLCERFRHCSFILLLMSEAAFPLPSQEGGRSTSCNSQRYSTSTSFLFSSKHLAKLKYGWLLYYMHVSKPGGTWSGSDEAPRV